MKFIEDQLEAMDGYFATKKENEKWMIIIVIAAIIAYLSYIYLVPYTKKLYDTSERNKKRIEKSIHENTAYLKSITVNGDREFYVKKYTNEIVQKKENTNVLNKRIVFINHNLEKLSDMLFNQKSWSIFLNSITDRAATQNVDIEYINNHYVDSNGSFGHVLEIGIGCNGAYKAIIKFINELEQNDLVTDIYNTHFTVDNNSSQIRADINISVWGINH